MKTNIKIHLKDGITEMLCTYVAMTNTIVEVKEFLHSDSGAVFFEKKHSSLQTQFVLTNAQACWLIVFDENKKFMTVKPHFYQGEAPFSLLIPEPYVLLLPASRKLKFEDIYFVEFTL